MAVLVREVTYSKLTSGVCEVHTTDFTLCVKYIRGKKGRIRDKTWEVSTVQVRDELIYYVGRSRELKTALTDAVTEGGREGGKKGNREDGVRALPWGRWRMAVPWRRG